MTPAVGAHHSRTWRELSPTLLYSVVLAVSLPEGSQGKLGVFPTFIPLDTGPSLL